MRRAINPVARRFFYLFCMIYLVGKKINTTFVIESCIVAHLVPLICDNFLLT